MGMMKAKQDLLALTDSLRMQSVGITDTNLMPLIITLGIKALLEWRRIRMLSLIMG